MPVTVGPGYDSRPTPVRSGAVRSGRSNPKPAYAVR